MSQLERFKRAQDEPHSGFATALAELRAGRKESHWIWYVFPQLIGLGRSEASQTYGIVDVAEATDYLRDPVLCRRLLEAATAVVERQRAGVPLSRLMGEMSAAYSQTWRRKYLRGLSQKGSRCVRL